MKPRLYLDVDGVVNAFSRHRVWGPMHSGPAVTGGYEYMIMWAPAMVEELKSLDLELVWTTTWRGDAPRAIGSLVGWGENGRVLHPNDDPDAEAEWPSIEWKLAAVSMDQTLRGQSPFIWCDDEIGNREIDFATEADGLALTIDPQFGITPANIEQMRRYLAYASAEV